MIENSGELVTVATVLILVVISLLGVFGFETVAVVVTIVGLIGGLPLLAVFGDRWPEEGEDDEVTDQVERARNR